MRILLVRHGEAFCNINDLAFGNQNSPLTEHGVGQAQDVGTNLVAMGIDPEAVVATSTYTRTQQTASVAGFHHTVELPLIDESALDPIDFDWSDLNKPMDKHAQEHWIPLETIFRAAELVFHVQRGTYPYPVYFTHGLFIAGVLTVCEIAGIETNYPWDVVRGYVPLRAQIVPLEIG